MKNIVLEAFSAVILLVGAFIVLGGCEEKEQIKLKGTSWKLKGIYNNNTKEFKVLAPENCNDCYSFTFDTDTTADCKSVLVRVRRFESYPAHHINGCSKQYAVVAEQVDAQDLKSCEG